MDYRILIKIYKRTKFNCQVVKIHNETCLLFCEYILATLHITLSSHNPIPALKTHCRQMLPCLGIQETIFCFITLRCIQPIQAKINEQLIITLLFGLVLLKATSRKYNFFFLIAKKEQKKKEKKCAE